jgi:hypothetical protein
MLGKAIQFANQLECNLHLLHVVTPSTADRIRNRIYSFLGIRVTNLAIKQRLALWQSKYASQLKKGLLLFISVEKGDDRKIISEYIETHDIDMLLADEPLRYLPEVSGHYTDQENFPIRSHYAVLTLTPSLGLHGLKTIILPVGKNLALNKLRIAVYIARQFDAVIHLIAIELNDESAEQLPYMKKAFRILRDNTHIPVICKTLNGRDEDIVLMQYGKSVNADLVIVNPDSFKGSLVKGTFRSFRKKTQLPVLAVD